MSLDAMSWAVKLTGITPTEKLVLVVLGNYADEDGYAYPRQATLAANTGLSREGVGRVLSALARKDLLEVADVEVPRRKAPRNSGQFRGRVYELHVGASPRGLGSHGEARPASADGGGQDDSPCDLGSHGDAPRRDPGSHGRVIDDHTGHVIQDHTASNRGIETVSSETVSLKEERKTQRQSLLLSAERSIGSPTGEELNALLAAMNDALGFEGLARLPPDLYRVERIWKHCAGDVEEAARVAGFALAQCRKVSSRAGLRLAYLADNYADLRAAMHQEQQAPADDAAAARARRREELLGGSRRA